MLAEITKAGRVTVTGPASGPGWTGARYAFSASLGAEIKLSGTVSVDQQGQARAFVLTIRANQRHQRVRDDAGPDVQRLRGAGAPPPPADQTFPGP